MLYTFIYTATLFSIMRKKRNMYFMPSFIRLYFLFVRKKRNTQISNFSHNCACKCAGGGGYVEGFGEKILTFRWKYFSSIKKIDSISFRQTLRVGKWSSLRSMVRLILMIKSFSSFNFYNIDEKSSMLPSRFES